MNDPMQSARPRSRPHAEPDLEGSISLFDIEDAKAEGMARAIHGADVRWKVAAEETIRRLALTGREFTIDDVTDRCGRALASSPHALGALMNAAARRRQIRRVGYQPSRAPSRQGAIVSVWVGTGESA
ncbi:MAG: hypothetical protein JJT89_06600 [Nitriliruptoraceae bacterium]|nr:hypothetical protein [Nitriliruptoraceae bacterium]